MTRSIWDRNRTAARERAAYVIARDEGICWLCGYGGANTVDHVVPRVKGGGDQISNLRAAHRECNSAKGDRAPDKASPSRPW